MDTRIQSPLAQAGVTCFTELQFLLIRLRKQLVCTKWRIILGGKLPRDEYSEMITRCKETYTASSMVGYVSASFILVVEASKVNNKGVEKWLSDFQKLLSTLDMASDEVASALVMLSNHMASALPFASYPKLLETCKLAKKLEELNHGMLQVEHILEPGYAAFVTMMMIGRGITRALGRQIEIVKELVAYLIFRVLWTSKRRHR
ncbi:hypothetical protein H2198_004129 [Neophaeococcomyces mojaviensis]|uniref:Uncharacterized protein n=1 Tax=Neophaeococcomyces mojaviensis TaxID=3383035 RepID=A0ACC3A9Q2_9EURO|nr:hypothetical protein H2198_004129 [Knufia sp. JES_112]